MGFQATHKLAGKMLRATPKLLKWCGTAQTTVGVQLTLNLPAHAMPAIWWASAVRRTSPPSLISSHEAPLEWSVPREGLDINNINIHQPMSIIWTFIYHSAMAVCFGLPSAMPHGKGAAGTRHPLSPWIQMERGNSINMCMWKWSNQATTTGQKSPEKLQVLRISWACKHFKI